MANNHTQIVMIFLCYLGIIGCSGSNKTLDSPRTLKSEIIVSCDSTIQLLNQIHPSFEQAWKKDSLGCQGFRGQVVFLKHHLCFKGASSRCLLGVLGAPNRIAEMDDGKAFTYTLSSRECEKSLPYSGLIIGFNQLDICDGFSLIME